MTQQALDRGDWQAVIAAHPLESHDPQEWLRYGVALLQTIEPGPDVGKQQQQAALAFVQAQKEGATAEQVAAMQRQSVLLSLREALTLADIPIPEQLGAGASAEPQPPTPGDPLQELTAALARVFDLELPQRAAVLDQLLAAKGQLRDQALSAAGGERATARPGAECCCRGRGPAPRASQPGASLARCSAEGAAGVALSPLGVPVGRGT
jgi:hypothetical protein